MLGGVSTGQRVAHTVRSADIAGRMDLKPILAVTVGVAIYRGIVSPMLARYFAWRDGPRVQTARRNWRGVYVPDLNVRRGERIFWLAYLGIIVLGLAIGWTVMVPGSGS